MKVSATRFLIIRVTRRALEIYMLSMPEPRPVGDGAVGRDLRRHSQEDEGGDGPSATELRGRTTGEPSTGQPAPLLGGPV